MDTVQFRVDQNASQVDIFVNDRDLIDIIRAIELSMAEKDGTPSRAA